VTHLFNWLADHNWQSSAKQALLKALIIAFKAFNLAYLNLNITYLLLWSF